MNQILSFSEHAYLGIVAIIIFMSVFLGALVWMFRPGSKQAYAIRSQMPLVDDQPLEPVKPGHP